MYSLFPVTWCCLLKVFKTSWQFHFVRFHRQYIHFLYIFCVPVAVFCCIVCSAIKSCACWLELLSWLITCKLQQWWCVEVGGGILQVTLVSDISLRCCSSSSLVHVEHIDSIFKHTTDDVTSLSTANYYTLSVLSVMICHGIWLGDVWSYGCICVLRYCCCVR